MKCHLKLHIDITLQNWVNAGQTNKSAKSKSNPFNYGESEAEIHVVLTTLIDIYLAYSVQISTKYVTQFVSAISRFKS